MQIEAGKSQEDRRLDIIAEWTDEPAGPVRTRTVTEIVPGVFSRVVVRNVSEEKVIVRLQKDLGDDATLVSMTAAELRAAAAVFVQLADALEGGAS